MVEWILRPCWSWRRFPDATIRHRCVDDSGQPDSALAGLYEPALGRKQVVLSKDIRTTNGESVVRSGDPMNGMRSSCQGVLSPDNWRFGTIGHEVLKQYLGYDLGFLVPEVRGTGSVSDRK